MRKTCLRLLLGLIAFCEATVVAQEPYKFLNEVPIGGEGGWDILTIDSAAHRLYLSHATKVVATAPIGEHVDGCVFDDATQLAFASGGDGTVTIVKEETPEKLRVVQTLKTERGARTIALDPQTHRIYLPTAQFEPAPSPSPGASPGRPTMLPNTMKLLVYGAGEAAK